MAREHLLHVDLNAVPNGYTQERLTQVANDAVARFSAILGVVAVSYSENGIFWGSEVTYTIGVPGYSATSMADSSAHADLVGPGYVKAIGGRLLRGRDIEMQDAKGAANVAVVNEALVRHFFSGRDPLGQAMRLDDSTTVTVVGVVADVKDHSLTKKVEPRMYMSFAQHPAGWAGYAHLIVRTSGDPVALVPQARAALAAMDKRFRNNSIDTVVELMRDSIAQERLLSRLATGFGLLALILAAVGLYGVMTYAVTRRTAEIGLRVALGAQRGDVIRLVLTDAMTVVIVGVAVGIPAALGAAQLLKAQLYGVSTSDPLAISVAVGVLVASAAGATLVPALRASRVAPLLSLRQE